MIPIHTPHQLIALNLSRYEQTGRAIENKILSDYLKGFSRRLEYIFKLERQGRISSQEAHAEIKLLWQQLEQTKQDLGVHC